MSVLDLSNIVVRLLVAVLLYFFGEVIINQFVANPDSKKLFTVILLIVCVCIIFFGNFLPIR